MPRGIYTRTKPTGFLHPVHNYRITVNGRERLHDRRKREAWKGFRSLVRFQVRSGAVNWTVILTRDGEPLAEESRLSKCFVEGEQ